MKIAISPYRRARNFGIGVQVMIDRDLAALYGVSVKRLNEQVKRNQKRFPSDFMFQLSKEDCLRLQIATLNGKRGGKNMGCDPMDAKLGTRATVACCDIAKGETGPVYVRGDFFFDCDDDYECDETATIAYDFKRKRFVPVGTKGSLIIGAALLPTPKGSKFVGVALNG